MRRRRYLSGAAVALTAALSGCASALGRQEREPFSTSTDIDPDTTVTVRNRNGPVTVVDADDDRLRVSGEKSAGSQAGLDSIDIEVRTSATTTVEAVFEQRSSFTNRAVDLTVAVPDGVRVETVLNDNGPVRVSNVAGDLTASATNGSITIDGVDGFVTARSTNGGVDVSDTTGIDGIQTTNGPIDADLFGLRGDVTCETTNGSVTIRVADGVSSAFELTTTNGRASVVDLEHTASIDRRRRVEGTLRGANAPLLAARTTNGDVTLRPV